MSEIVAQGGDIFSRFEGYCRRKEDVGRHADEVEELQL